MKRIPTAGIVATLSLLTLWTASPLAAQQAGDERRDPVTNRRISDNNDEPVVLNFNKVKISDTIDFIVETSENCWPMVAPGKPSHQMIGTYDELTKTDGAKPQRRRQMRPKDEADLSLS